MTEITARLSTALAGRYKIDKRLGEGGMATVYLAEDLKHKRKVAVKVLRPELARCLGLNASCRRSRPRPIHANYDVHPDGDRFVMVKQSERQPELTVVLNFFEELKARVGN